MTAIRVGIRVAIMFTAVVVAHMMMGFIRRGRIFDMQHRSR